MIHIDYLADHEELLPELASLHFQEWGYLRPEQTLQDRIEQLRAQCGRHRIPMTVVAIQGDALVGSAQLVTHDMDTRTDLSPWLAGVYVKSAHRKQGIATRLVRRVEREAAALGVTRLYLFTPSEEAFYSRRGWLLMERCDYKGLTVAVMEKFVGDHKRIATPIQEI